jgi:hypothetical protein
MPRPVSTEEITERSRSIGRIEVERLGTHPSLLKAYAALLDAVTKMGGHAEQRYSNVELFIPKTAQELADQLESDQRRWDSTEALWLRAVRADEGDELREYERETVVAWCEAEGKPNPFDPFAARDEDLAAIRRELGLVG